MGLLKTLGNLIKAITLLIAALQENTKALRLKRPGLVFVTVTHEVNEMLFFKLALPPKSAIDVVRRKLTVKVGEAEPQVYNLGADEVESIELAGQQGDVVEGTLVDIDDAENPSDPSKFSETLTDTIAPPVPGQVGIQVLREEP